MITQQSQQPSLSLEQIAANFKAAALTILTLKYQTIACKPLCIWGTSLFGRTVKKILEDCGYGAQIKCFINSFHSPQQKTQIDGIDELDPTTALNCYQEAVIIIASDFFPQIEATIRNLHASNQLFRIVSSQHSSHLEKLLRFYYFSVADSLTPIDVIGDLKDWFAFFYHLKQQGTLTEQTKQITALLEDEESVRCFLNLVGFYTSGNLQLLLETCTDEPQYFSPHFYPITDKEVIFDCGAFNGDTIRLFTQNHTKYAKILAFEPDSNSVTALSSFINHRKLANIKIIQAAVGNAAGNRGFIMQGTQGGHLVSSDRADSLINTIRLDDFFADRPTLIKMDIEGAELEALQGAQRIISTYRPKLAICVYHRPEDLFSIPLYLKELNPEYHFKLRKHSQTVYETVLYAY